MNVLQAIEKFGESAVKDIEVPFTQADKVMLLVEKGATDAPATLSVVKTIMEMVLGLGADGSTAVSADGLNIADDLKLVSDGKALFDYCKNTAIPAFEKDWSDLTGDVKSATTSTLAVVKPAAPAAPVVAAEKAAPEKSPQFASVFSGPSEASTTTVQAAAIEQAGGEAAVTASPGLHNTVKP